MAAQTFSAAEFQRKAAEQRPWRSRPNSGSSIGSRRAGRMQVEALTGERTEMLQAYLSAQLSNLTDDTAREAMEAGLLRPAGSDAPASRASSRGGRRRRPGSRATSLSSLDAGALDDALLSGLEDARARPLEQSERIVPGDQRTYARPGSRGSAVSSNSTALSQKPLVERWPAKITQTVDVEPPPQAVAPQQHYPEAEDGPDASGMRPPSGMMPRPVPSIADSGAPTAQLSKAVPKLLGDLEHFVATELAGAGVAGAENAGHPDRLRIFGEVFDCFIEHCTTYQPLLSKVKQEFDAAITALKTENESIKPTTTKLAVMEAEQEDELISQQHAFLRETHGLREALKAAQAEREELVGKVTRQAEELRSLRERTANDQVLKKEKDELNDALTTGINHLKTAHADSDTLFQERERLAMELEEAKHKINMLNVKNEGGVGKSEWDSWCKKIHTMEKSDRMQRRENDRLVREVEKKSRNEARAEARLTRMKADFHEMKAKGTPRPSVDPLLSTLEMEEKELREDAGARSSKEVFDYTCRRLKETLAELERLRSLTPNDDPYFMGLGPGTDDAEVPPYLKTKKNAQIRNRRMPKKDVEAIIKQIWKKKTFSDQQAAKTGKAPKELPEFFYDYMKMEYGVQNAIAEVSYNLLDSCKRYNCAPTPPSCSPDACRLLMGVRGACARR